MVVRRVTYQSWQPRPLAPKPPWRTIFRMNDGVLGPEVESTHPPRRQSGGAYRLEMHDAARSSQRAWREELLDAEGKIEGPASEPLLSELPVLGREQQSGRAETRHGHVHALGRSKNTRSRCGAV